MCRTSQLASLSWLRMSQANIYSRYESLFGCDNIDLTNTSSLYARYTTTVICNSIVQNSIDPCGLSSSQAEPVCADTCVSYNGHASIALNSHSSRHNSRKARHTTSPIPNYAPALAAELVNRSGPISRTVRCLRTHYHPLLALKEATTSRTIADTATAPLVSAHTAHLVGLTRPTLAATIRMPRTYVPMSHFLPSRRP